MTTLVTNQVNENNKACCSCFSLVRFSYQADAGPWDAIAMFVVLLLLWLL